MGETRGTRRKPGKPAKQGTPQHKSYTRQSGPKIEATFQRMLKLLDEHIKRHEIASFMPELWNEEHNQPKYSPKLAKEAKELAQSLAGLGSLFLRIQKEQRAAADLMTLDEKIDAIEALSEELGKLQSRKFLARLYEIARKLEKRHLGPYHTSKAESKQLVEDARAEFAKPHYPDSFMSPDSDDSDEESD